MGNLGLFWVLSPTEGGWGGGRTCREWHLLFAPLDRKPRRLNFTHKNKGRQKKTRKREKKQPMYVRALFRLKSV
jgi:hypothetical protein